MINNVSKDKVSKAIFHAKRMVKGLVYDAIQLEGINFTLPEVQTLLDGVAAGGKSKQDENVVLNQHKAWRFLFDVVMDSKLNLSEQFVCRLHNIAAKEIPRCTSHD